MKRPDPVFGEWRVPHGMRLFFGDDKGGREGAFSPLLINVFTSLPLAALVLLGKACHRF